MKYPVKTTLRIALLAFVIILPACGPATPTADPYLVYTQAAETVMVQLSQTAAALPTSTATPIPTETPIPATATNTPVPVTPTLSVSLVATSTLSGLPPTSTSAGPKTGDSATYGSQTPADGSVFSRGQEFQVMFSMVNTGTTTWTPEYALVFKGGTPLSSVSSVPCGETVKPGGKCDFYIGAIAPSDLGTYTSHWKMVNTQNVWMGEVYLTFKVQ